MQYLVINIVTLYCTISNNTKQQDIISIVLYNLTHSTYLYLSRYELPPKNYLKM